MKIQIDIQKHVNDGLDGYTSVRMFELNTPKFPYFRTLGIFLTPDLSYFSIDEHLNEGLDKPIWKYE